MWQIWNSACVATKSKPYNVLWLLGMRYGDTNAVTQREFKATYEIVHFS